MVCWQFQQYEVRFIVIDAANRQHGKMKRGVVIHSSPPTHSVRVPHVRTSVRGIRKTGRSPIKALSFLFSVTTKTRVPHISLVFCEMWDTTALPPNPFPADSAYPTLRQLREGWGTRALVVTEGVFLLRDVKRVINSESDLEQILPRTNWALGRHRRAQWSASPVGLHPVSVEALVDRTPTFD